MRSSDSSSSSSPCSFSLITCDIYLQSGLSIRVPLTRPMITGLVQCAKRNSGVPCCSHELPVRRYCFDAFNGIGERYRDHVSSLESNHYTAFSIGQQIEEHTSELQSPCNLVCRLLLEKKQ